MDARWFFLKGPDARAGTSPPRPTIGYGESRQLKYGQLSGPLSLPLLMTVLQLCVSRVQRWKKKGTGRLKHTTGKKKWSCEKNVIYRDAALLVGTGAARNEWPTSCSRSIPEMSQIH